MIIAKMQVSGCSFVGFVCLLALCSALDFTGFEPIADPPQDFTILEFGITCPVDSEFVGKVSSIHWIVEPVKMNTVEILTSPPKLVDASATDGVLRFTYNPISMAVHEAGAGVLIRIPEDQLESIISAPESFFKAKVLKGFTKLTSITQEGAESFLVVLVNSTGTPFKVADSGRANSLYLGTDVVVEADISGPSSTVTIDGTIKSGTLSGSNCLVWADETIQQLTVTGGENRVFTADGNTDGGACNNVEFQLERNVCDLTNTPIPIPPVSITSTDEVLLSCIVSKTTKPEPTSGTWRQFGKPLMLVVAMTPYLWRF